MRDDPASSHHDPPPTPGDGTRTPFERFEELTRQLVKVPKSAIAAQRKHDKDPDGTPQDN